MVSLKSMNYLSSRTIQVAILMFVFNGVQSMEGLVSQNLLILINAVLTALVAYFRANPKAKFK